MDITEDLSPGTPSHEKVQDEVQSILEKMRAGMADMNEEEMEEFRKGFVHKLAEKVRQASAGEAERVAASGLGQGVYITLAAFLILAVLFGLVGYKIYQYVQLEEQKKNAKGRTKSLKKSKRKDK